MFYKHLAIAAIKKMNSNADKRNSSEIFLHVVPITWGKVSRNLPALLSPAEKKQPANLYVRLLSDRRGFHSGITSSAICTFEETVICLRHLNQIWFTCNHARAFERNHIFMRWQISDIMWAFRDNIK